MKLMPPNVAAYWSCRPPAWPTSTRSIMVGEMGDVVFAERQRQQFAVCLDHRDDEGGRRPQTGSGRRVGRGHHGHRQAGAAEELPDDPPIDRLVQREQSRRCKLRVGVRLDLLLIVQRDELHLAVAAHLDRAVGEHVDCCVQHAAAERVAVGRDVGAAAGEAKAQRCTGAHLGHPARIGRAAPARSSSAVGAEPRPKSFMSTRPRGSRSSRRRGPTGSVAGSASRCRTPDHPSARRWRIRARSVR